MRREGYYELAQAVTRVFDDSSEEGQPVVARAVAV